jgi:hypothetical protein
MVDSFQGSLCVSATADSRQATAQFPGSLVDRLDRVAGPGWWLGGGGLVLLTESLGWLI